MELMEGGQELNTFRFPGRSHANPKQNIPFRLIKFVLSISEMFPRFLPSQDNRIIYGKDGDFPGKKHFSYPTPGNGKLPQTRNIALFLQFFFCFPAKTIRDNFQHFP